MGVRRGRIVESLTVERMDPASALHSLTVGPAHRRHVTWTEGFGRCARPFARQRVSMADYNPSYDLASAAAMASELEPYLLSKELYWPLTAASPVPFLSLPRLTLGGLFLALARLRAVEKSLTADQLASLHKAQSMLEQVRSQWAAAMDRKMVQELKSRLDLWQAFLGDCRDNRARCAEGYPNEVHIRVMIGLLVNEISPYADAGSARTRLAEQDATLRRMFSPGPFVWAPELQPSFPAGAHWFLYGAPRN